MVSGWCPDRQEPHGQGDAEADVLFEAKIGIRSSDAEFEITERFDPKKK
jgi:hypothetical protein